MEGIGYEIARQIAKPILIGVTIISAIAFTLGALIF